MTDKPTAQEVRELRKSLEEKIKAAKENERNARNVTAGYEGELHRLQLDCPHENVTEGSTWQGGGRYYTRTHCHDCGKDGERYRPDLTRKAYQDKDGNYKYVNQQEHYFTKLDEHERDTHYLYGRYWTTAEDRRREEAEAAAKLTPEIKHWFGDGEADVDAMIRAGALTAVQVLKAWNSRPEVPCVTEDGQHHNEGGYCLNCGMKLHPSEGE